MEKREGRGDGVEQAHKPRTADCPWSCEALTKSFLLFLDKVIEMRVDWG